MESRRLNGLMRASGQQEQLFRGLTRRQFLKFCAGLAIALGLSDEYAPKIAAALEEIPRKTPILWIQSQVCSGCFVSLLNSTAPSPANVILDSVSFRFHPNLQASSGEPALSILNESVERLAGHYVLVVEGALTSKSAGGFAQYGQSNGQKGPLLNWLKKLAPKADLVVALGTCASFGGIPAAGITGSRPVKTQLDSQVVNIPGCPPHPDWLIGTMAKLQLFGKDKVLETLDRHGRPTEFFGELVHDQCPRRHFFESGKFTDDWNNPRDAGQCLFRKGCKGPVTMADCPQRQWNGGVSWCVEVNHPCIGCTEPQFYRGMSPIYEALPDVSLVGQRLRPETVGKVIGAATAVGIGGHLMEMVATGKLPKRANEGKKKERPVKDD